MSSIQVGGLRPLSGSVEIQGSKNAVLPIMAAALLSRGVTVIRRVPAIADVSCMMGILRSLGCACLLEGGCLTIDASVLSGIKIPEEFVGKMRSSCLFLGPLLARAGEAATCYPGGCVLGKRPIDLHLSALRSLGAEIAEEDGLILARTRGLKGCELSLAYPSVGATENILMAAATAEGTTVLKNCAREPEIVELCGFLASMGAKIWNTGGSTLVIEGVKELHPCDHELSADRICAGTYLAAACAAAGDVTVRGLAPGELQAPLWYFRKMGAEVFADERENTIRLIMEERPKGIRLATGPYPSFPTDLQSVFLAAACVAEGESRIRETVFEARFEAAKQMKRLGARIRLEGRTAIAEGRYPLRPGVLEAPDLRGGAALIVAALAAEGTSIVKDCGHIERGYEDICRDLSELGAQIERL